MSYSLRGFFVATSAALALVALSFAQNASATVVSYRVEVGFQGAFGGTFTVPDTSAAIGTTSTSTPAVTSITSDGVTGAGQVVGSFTPTQYNILADSDLSSPLVEWTNSSTDSYLQFYSITFYDFVRGGGTWDQAYGNSYEIETAAGFAVDSNDASLFTDGGTLVFSAAVPEPSTAILGLAGLAWVATQFHRRSQR